MTEPPAQTLRPARRVAIPVTAYLAGHLGGYYDMRTRIEGGETFSIPEYCVNHDAIVDLGPEQLTADDWDEIEQHVYARLGSERAAPLIAQWRHTAGEVAF